MVDDYFDLFQKVKSTKDDFEKLAIKFKEKDYYELLKFLLEKELEMRNSEKNKEAIFWEVITYLKLFNSF